MTIAMFLFAGLTTNAQGTWSTVTVEADELKGIKGGEVYRYSVDGMGTIEITDWKNLEMAYRIQPWMEGIFHVIN